MSMNALAFLVLVVFQSAAHPSEIVGKVVGVMDGDTVEVLSPQKEVHRIRVMGIDAPEKGQPFGQSAKRLMSDMAFAQVATVTWRKRDRYGRIVGKVVVRGKDVGLAMVRGGMAWHYKQYQSEQETEDRLSYSNAELTARATKTGLWGDPAPSPPWDFRKSALSYGPQGGAETCPCSGLSTCLGPKGGTYCVEATGRKQYKKSARLLVP